MQILVQRYEVSGTKGCMAYELYIPSEAHPHGDLLADVIMDCPVTGQSFRKWVRFTFAYIKPEDEALPLGEERTLRFQEAYAKAKALRQQVLLAEFPELGPIVASGKEISPLWNDVGGPLPRQDYFILLR